jgi:signal transduction histidine kinase
VSEGPATAAPPEASSRPRGPRARPDAAPAFADLDAVLREVLPGSGDALAAAQRRVRHLVAAPGSGSSPVVPFVYAASALSSAPEDGRVKPLQLQPLVDALAARAELAEEATRVQLYTIALGEVATLDEPAESILRRVLHLVCAIAPASGASAWLLDAASVPPLRRTDAVGTHARGRRRLAASAARGLLSGHAGGTDCAVAMPDRTGVVLARPCPDADVRCIAFLGMAANVLGARVEDARFRSVAGRQQSTLVDAAERRLVRLGLDLHDGPAQAVAALAADARLVRSRLDELPGVPAPATAFLDDLVERLGDLGTEIRDLAGSLESRSIVRRPLAGTLRQELNALARSSGITTSLEVSGDLSELTASQQIALVRTAQEVFANVREHSRATHVAVSIKRAGGKTCLEIGDDGRGFDVVRTREWAARHGRLGLAGMPERLALVGGTFQVVSRPGGPTTVRAVVPDWSPPGEPSSPDERRRSFAP